MIDGFSKLHDWVDAGEPLAVIAAGALVALCFIVFNALRVLLYLPQIATCWADEQGCPTINLFTWCSWIVANASTGVYMWVFLGDALGLALNLGNAAMCAITVVVTVIKRRHWASVRLGPNGARRLPQPPAPQSASSTGPSPRTPARPAPRAPSSAGP
jgi:hypothetical protein